MLFKNLLLMLMVVGSSACSFTGSNDGGGSDSEKRTTNDKNAVNGANTGGYADNSGANKALEGSYAVKVFNGINRVRAKNSLPALTRDSQMDSLAAKHNAGMISRASLSRAIDIDHKNAKGRAKAIFPRGFSSYGENTAGIRGHSSSVVPSVLVKGWVDSPGHFVNIIGDFTTTGVAVTVDPRDGTIYSTQIFAK